MASPEEIAALRAHGLQSRAESQQHAIVDGPSKWDLMLSLFDGDCDHRRPVAFKVRRANGFEYSVAVTINEVGREDGSGENWNIHGYLNSDPTGMFKAGVPVRCFFTTKRRTGWLKPVA
ncbi:MAG: hypothetical protein Q7S23_00075 [bacterium]|nr:hypothetical protein [bacterium]